MVICPQCGKNTPEGKFCEQCGANISAPPPVTQPQEMPTGPQKPYATNYILIGLYIVGLLFVFVNPVVFFISVLINAGLIYADAKAIGAGTKSAQEKAFESVTWKPVSWAVLAFFFWIVVVPFYLVKRKELFSFNA
jgi:hypothetical protein